MALQLREQETRVSLINKRSLSCTKSNFYSKPLPKYRAKMQNQDKLKDFDEVPSLFVLIFNNFLFVEQENPGTRIRENSLPDYEQEAAKGKIL